ncbi:MAG: T9SS type A sorting domain-containing protein [Tannerellaceae bacterium]|nr:T9SS type A sorting domain-containing protein [Tannerellaceae bacterium]
MDEEWVDLFFDIKDEQNYGLHREDSERAPVINKIAQNQVSRVDQHLFYNAGAYALAKEPEEEPQPDFQWSVSTTGSDPDHFYDVRNNASTVVKERTPVHLQVIPVIPNLSYDKWKIEYEAIPMDYYYEMSNQEKDVHFLFNQGNPHIEVGTYVYKVKELYLYAGNRLVKEYTFDDTSFTYTVIIEEEDDNEGGGSPGPAIHTKEIAPFCYNEGEFRIPLERLDVENKLEYRILFSSQAQLAGLEDVSEYTLLSGLYVTVPVRNSIPEGTYEGTIYIRINGNDDLVQFYPFELKVKEMTRIIHQPEGVVNLCEGDGFRLSVEAVGDELSYQWYYHDQPIPGANQPTYEAPVTDDTQGSYYVEVKGSCNNEISEKVSVLMKQFHIYMKWEDTMAVLDPENQYTSYQWYKNGQPVSIHGNAVYYTDANGLEGSYFVRAYKQDHTYDESCPMLFETNIRSLATSVYPSVVDKGQFVTVYIGTEPEEAAGAYIRIHDLSGRIVLHTRVVEPVVPLYAPAVSGAYLVTISLENGKVFTHKILVK